VVMSLSQMGETIKHTHMGFVHESDSDDRRLTGDLKRTGSLRLRERGSGFGINESLAATLDEVIEFQVLDPAATERIISERLSELSARLKNSQPVVISMAPQLASFFAKQLASERKSLAQLERLLQETIIIPFTHLDLDARNEVTISIEDESVSVRVHSPSVGSPVSAEHTDD